MRRLIVLVLAGMLGLGGLAACGKKGPPRLPGGEELRVQPKGTGGDQSIGVAPPQDEDQVDLDKPEFEEAPSPEPAPGTKPPPASSVDDSGAEVAPEQGLPPSPGSPQEPGF
jgi:predicted small lipoprotein YifL